jgi:hypothetical protein
MTATPHSKYFRHRLFKRVRHNRHGILAFVTAQASRLAASATGQTVAPHNATNDKAQATVVFSANPAANDTLTIGAVTYKFVSALVNPNDVLIGAAATNTIDNLVAAITAGAGAGTTYGTGTVAHTQVTAANSTGLLLTALTALIKGKQVALAKSSANITLPTNPHLDGPLWTATGHAFHDGEGPVFITNSGGALPTGTPTGELWVHVVDANTVAFATSQHKIESGDFIQTTTAGTGTQTAARGTTAAAIFDLLKQGNKPRTVAAASDIDALK